MSVYFRQEAKRKWSLPSHVQLFATPWTVAFQALPSMGFSRKKYWVGCHFFLQDIFPTQGSTPGLLHCRQTPYCLSHQWSPQDKKDIKNQLSKKKKRISFPLHLNMVVKRNGKHGSGEQLNTKTYLGKRPLFDNSGSGRSSKVNILDPICVQLSDNCHYLTQYWRRKGQPTPVFLPGESQGQRNLVGCCLWGRTESDTTEVT